MKEGKTMKKNEDDGYGDGRRYRPPPLRMGCIGSIELTTLLVLLGSLLSVRRTALRFTLLHFALFSLHSLLHTPPHPRPNFRSPPHTLWCRVFLLAIRPLARPLNSLITKRYISSNLRLPLLFLFR